MNERRKKICGCGNEENEKVLDNLGSVVFDS
jgi:hypothetical protein